MQQTVTICFLPVKGPKKPPVKNHFFLHFQLYSFECHVTILQEPVKILALSIFGLDDVRRHQYFLCPDL